MLWHYAALVGLALCITTNCQAIIRDARIPDKHYKTLANYVSAACQISILNKDKSFSYGSGVLVGGRGYVILTAAHVVESMGPTGIVRFGSNEGKDEQVRLIRNVIIHPSYIPLSKVDGSQVDLAILILDKPVDLAGLEPARLVNTSHPAVAQENGLIFVGYGATGTHATGIDQLTMARIKDECHEAKAEVRRHFTPGVLCSHAEKMQVFACSLVQISRKYPKRLMFTSAPLIVSHDPAEAVARAAVVESPHPEKQTFLPSAEEKMAGLVARGDSGGGLWARGGELVGILTHTLTSKQSKKILTNWVSVPHYLPWIKAEVALVCPEEDLDKSNNTQRSIL